jgi:hypothetical protein
MNHQLITTLNNDDDANAASYGDGSSHDNSLTLLLLFLFKGQPATYRFISNMVDSVVFLLEIATIAVGIPLLIINDHKNTFSAVWFTIKRSDVQSMDDL